MSGTVPKGLPEDQRAFLQTLQESTGGFYEIRLVRVSDTACKIRMKGADGVWRESAPITLS